MMALLERYKGVKRVLILAVLSYAFLMLGNSSLSLTNPDEVFYSQTAKEMMQQDSWMTPYLFGEPQFEKPILTYWLLRFGFELFGVSSFSARFFPALWGMLGVLCVYGLGLVAFKDSRRAMWSALCMMSSSLYIGLSRTVFTDLFFTVFILGSLAAFFWGYRDRSRKGIGWVLAFVSSGLAVLTKGPLGFIVPGAVILVFLIARKDLKFILCRQALLGFLLGALVALPWYVFMIRTYGAAYVQEFFYNDHIRRLLEAEHLSNDTWFFYPVSIVGCIFPWSFYLLSAFVLFKSLRRDTTGIYLFLLCWIVVTLLIFQPAHSKLVSYIFPLFPALALLLGDYLGGVFEQKPGRPFIIAAYATTVFYSFLPVGLMFATQRFSEYIVSKPPIYIMAGILAVYSIVLFVLLARRRYVLHTALVSVILPALLYFAFSVHEDFDAYASGKEACELLVNEHEPGATVLASKFFARGVKYFTDKDVAVIDIAGEGYFSPHPVSYLNNDKTVMDFLRSRPVTFAILRKGSYKELQRIASGEFKIELLRVCGDEYVVKVTPL